MTVNKEFASKKDEVAYMVKHKKELIEFKRNQIQKSEPIYSSKGTLITTKQFANKAISSSSDRDTDDILFRTIVGNTYYWVDSHRDVHLDGCFSKSIKEREKFIAHLHDHVHKIEAKVGEPEKVYEESVSWSDLGVDKSGKTTSLLMDTEIIKEYNPKVFNQYKRNNINQHSVGMYYVKIKLAVNDEDYDEEYKVWLDIIDKLGNPEKAEEFGYFWAIYEAKLIEFSCVIQGSNELTPTGEVKDIEPDNTTQKKDPSEDNPPKSKLNFNDFI